MKVGVAHSAGKYTWPSGSGTQFGDGCSAIRNAGFRVLKVYCTKNYLTDYPLQTSWSSTPTSLKTLADTTQFVTELSKDWSTIVMTCFTFANGATNWWRVNPSAAAFEAEYAEMRELAEYLLETYSGSGKTFVLQNWEGDWAGMDSFEVETYVARPYIDRYAAFLGVRQRAIEDARKAVASDCRVLMAIEVNRVNDTRVKPHLRRILRDISQRVTPDVVSYSAYDSTIVDQGSWGATLSGWQTATVPMLTKCLQAIKQAWPGVPIQIGEFGFPEGPELPPGRDVGAMIQTVYDVCLAQGVETLIYWQVFGNDELSPGVLRGLYTVKPDGTPSVAGLKLASLV